MSAVDAPTAPTSDEPAPTTRSLAPQASITTALSIGWLLAELRFELSRPTAPSSSGSAAGLLSDVPTPIVRIRQIQGKLSLLHEDFEQVGVADADAVAALAKLEKLVIGPSRAGRTAKHNETESTIALPLGIDVAATNVHANLIEASTGSVARSPSASTWPGRANSRGATHRRRSSRTCTGRPLSTCRRHWPT